jgi:hypothetical protein
MGSYNAKRGPTSTASSGKFKFLTNVLADPNLSAAAKCVVTVLLLKFHNSRTGQCNPSITAIGDALGRDRRNIIRAIEELGRSGWVEISTTKGGSQRNTNRYKIRFLPHTDQ